MSIQLRDTSGRLTAYAFALGCVETHDSRRLTVIMLKENGVYHVRGHGSARIGSKCIRINRAFPSIRAARTYKSQLISAFKTGV